MADRGRRRPLAVAAVSAAVAALAGPAAALGSQGVITGVSPNGLVRVSSAGAVQGIRLAGLTTMPDVRAPLRSAACTVPRGGRAMRVLLRPGTAVTALAAGRRHYLYLPGRAGRTHTLNYRLLALGLARATGVGQTARLAARFRGAESAARRHKRGLWALACGGRAVRVIPPPGTSPAGPSPTGEAVPPRPPAGGTPAPGGRSKLTWPFSADSIWNMPLGTTGRYIPARLESARGFRVDVDRFIRGTTADPARTLMLPKSWDQRCGGTTSTGITVRVPDSLVVADAAPGSTPNNAGAFLQPDGRTLIQVSLLTRCASGGPVYGRPKGGEVSIYGTGIPGGHGGSGLSSIGGTIRRGELGGAGPIRHALKLEVGCAKYCSYASGPGGGPGFRWPARNADGYADATRYGGSVPGLQMGTLLALPAGTDIASLGLRTPEARLIATALRDYGAYVVDDTAYDGYAIATEDGVAEEVEAARGYQLSSGLWRSSPSPFYFDMMAVMPRLVIVDDNGPSSVGGAGSRRAPLAPPITD